MPISEVFMICNAYETGFGHGYSGRKLKNPYKEKSVESEAYDIGVKAGIEARIEEDKRKINERTFMGTDWRKGSIPIPEIEPLNQIFKW